MVTLLHISVHILIFFANRQRAKLEEKSENVKKSNASRTSPGVARSESGLYRGMTFRIFCSDPPPPPLESAPGGTFFPQSY